MNKADKKKMSAIGVNNCQQFCKLTIEKSKRKLGSDVEIILGATSKHRTTSSGVVHFDAESLHVNLQHRGRP